jgi:hypothetical protein
VEEARGLGYAYLYVPMQESTHFPILDIFIYSSTFIHEVFTQLTYIVVPMIYLL